MRLASSKKQHHAHGNQVSLVGADRLIFRGWGGLLPSFEGADRLDLMALGLGLLAASQSCIKELSGKS